MRHESRQYELNLYDISLQTHQQERTLFRCKEEVPFSKITLARLAGEAAHENYHFYMTCSIILGNRR